MNGTTIRVRSVLALCAAAGLLLTGQTACTQNATGTQDAASAPDAPVETFRLVIEASEGGTIEPAPGEHVFHVGDKVRLVATPAKDHVFDYWTGALRADLDPEAPVLEFVVDEDFRDITTGALFIARPGMSELDFASDLAFFLKEIKEPTPVEQFDKNRMHYNLNVDTSADPTAEREYSGNGMPDVAELYLVQAVLQSGRLGLTPHSGVASSVAWEAWTKNLALAQQDLPGHDPRVQRTFAAYMTLGDHDSTRLVRDLVWRRLVPVQIDGVKYDNEMLKWLSFDEDADNDGSLNVDEWKKACPDGSLDKLPAFAAAALDRAKK